MAVCNYLIERELINEVKAGFSFGYKKLSNRFVDWLFNNYYTEEFSIHYYDDIDEDTGKRRLDWCNWIDPFAEGIWHQTQKEVDKSSKNKLKSVKRVSVSNKDRIYYAQKEEYIEIFWYGRDIVGYDIWWIFRKKTK